MKLEKYSFGVGDRFGHQGKAQLGAFIKAKQNGIDIVPVWNKSHREHSIIGTNPSDVRTEADQSVQSLEWPGPYHVDADHINMTNVDGFIEYSDFFTLDVADYIGKPSSKEDQKSFLEIASKYVGALNFPGIDEQFEVTLEDIDRIGSQFLFAVKEAGRIYRHIEQAKGKDNFIAEISMDESDAPQTPLELFFILMMIDEEKIPAQTIAPKFTGRFNKGVDYVGDVSQFEKEFNQDIAVIHFAAQEFNLPNNLKLSVHSGSDKFSIYEPINKALKRFGAGVHIKTAGTTWLEELIGLAETGKKGLDIAKAIYKESLTHFDELCAPYATVIDIDKNNLPLPEDIDKWDGQTFTKALRHDPACSSYNPDLRQLLHVGYKIAAQMGDGYLDALEAHEESVAANVMENIYRRHLVPLFE